MDHGTLEIQLAIAGVLGSLGQIPHYVANAPKRMAVYYRLGAERAGFGAGQYLAINDLCAAFEVRYGREALCKMYVGATQQGWFINAFRGCVVPRSALLNALLIHFLFGSVAEFSEFARSRLPYVEELEQARNRRTNIYGEDFRSDDAMPVQLRLGLENLALSKDQASLSLH